MKKIYKKNDILQRIIVAKIFDQKKIFHNLIKNEIKLKLKNCEIYNDIFYIKKRIYVLNNVELKIKIIQKDSRIIIRKIYWKIIYIRQNKLLLLLIKNNKYYNQIYKKLLYL